MKVSVLLGSARPGGLDISFAGLAKQTYKDFEIVFVDALYKWRHAEVLEAVKWYDIRQPFFHVPNHRDSPSIWSTSCAGFNTGFMLANGDLCVFLTDYAYAAPNWLESHVTAQRGTPGKRLVIAPHRYRIMDLRCVPALLRGDTPKIFDERLGVEKGMACVEDILAQAARLKVDAHKISIFDHPFSPSDLERHPVSPSPHQDPKVGRSDGPIEHGMFHTKNESFWTATVLGVGGMDEHFDLGGGPGDTELGSRLARETPPWFCGAAQVECINPRSIMPNTRWGAHDRRLPPPHDKRWIYMDGLEYANRRMVEGGPPRNPFDILERQKEIWGWRELSQQPEAIIENWVVSDKDYFAGVGGISP